VLATLLLFPARNISHATSTKTGNDGPRVAVAVAVALAVAVFAVVLQSVVVRESNEGANVLKVFAVPEPLGETKGAVRA